VTLAVPYSHERCVSESARARVEAGNGLARRLRRRLAYAALGANLGGAVVVFLFAWTVFGRGRPHVGAATMASLSYVALVLPIALGWQRRRNAWMWRWLDDDRIPDAAERDLILREPVAWTVPAAALWGGAAVILAAVETSESLHGALEVGLTVLLGGVTVCALTYLLGERAFRPAIRRALSAGVPERAVGPGVGARLIMAWVLATGVPLLGLGALGAAALLGDLTDVASLGAGVLSLTVTALVAGLLATVLVAGSLAGSLRAMRAALAQVRGGDLDARVAVDDGSEIGLLQAGFNEMAAGLGERDCLRDLFGRHVGEDVARAALDAGAALGGEVREVAVLFVDLVGSTALAVRRPPTEVVALLNRFFGIVVDVTDAHGGLVNKFEGDAALCVFGAPIEDPRHSTAALAAARVLRERLRHDLPEADAGIGVSAGPVVAGNFGAERRLEYAVIGDSVNEAARLCELAKRRPERTLASDAVLARASTEEAGRWRICASSVLRGRSDATHLAVPAGGL
jgi:adenylate cyclase